MREKRKVKCFFESHPPTDDLWNKQTSPSAGSIVSIEPYFFWLFAFGTENPFNSRQARITIEGDKL